MSTRNAISDDQLSQVTGGSQAYDDALSYCEDLFTNYQQNGKKKTEFLNAVKGAFSTYGWEAGMEGTESTALQGFIDEWANTLGR